MRIDPKTRLFTFLLGIFAGLPALAIDISAPTLVLLPAALSSTTFVAGLTLSLFMVGFAFGQLVAGRLSDRYGRRTPLLAGLAVFTAAGAVAAWATTGPELVAARLVQGAGAGACAVLAFAMVQDLFEGEAARSKRSYVAAILSIAPVLAPALGAWVNGLAGWRAVYVVLAAGGTILLAVAWGAVGETRRDRNANLDPSKAAAVPLRRDARFIRLALINALSYGSIFAYVAGGPVVTMGQMRLSSAVYAMIWACTAVALSSGAWSSARLGRRGWSASHLVGPGLVLQAGSTTAMALAGPLSPSSAVWLLPCLLMSSFARGLTVPNLTHLAMGARRNDAGSAAAALGVTQLLGGALSSAAVAFLLPMLMGEGATGPMAVLAATAAVLWLTDRRCREETSSTRSPS